MTFRFVAGCSGSAELQRQDDRTCRAVYAARAIYHACSPVITLILELRTNVDEDMLASACLIDLCHRWDLNPHIP